MQPENPLFTHASPELIGKEDIVDVFTKSQSYSKEDKLENNPSLDTLVEKIVGNNNPDISYEAYLTREYDSIPDKRLSSKILLIRRSNGEDILLLCLLKSDQEGIDINNIVVGISNKRLDRVIVRKEEDEIQFTNLKDESIRKNIEEETLSAIEILEDKYELQLRERIAKSIGAQFVGAFHNGFARVLKTNDMWTFTDRVGKLMATEFESADDFHNGFARVLKTNGKYTFMGKDGELMNIEFESVGDFHNGFAAVKNSNGMWTLMGKDGELMNIEFKYVGEFHEGLARVKKTNDMWAFMSKDRILMDTKFKSVGNFHNGFAPVEKINEMWTFIDKDGKLMDTEFESVDYFHEGLAKVVVTKGLSYYTYYIDRKGRRFF